MIERRFGKFFDKELGGNDKANQMSKVVPYILAGADRVLLKVLFRFSLIDQQNINQFKGKKNGAVIVAPHTSYLDTLALFSSVRPQQWVRIIARENLFEIAGGFIGFFIARIGVFPIKRNTADRTAIKRASRMLKRGEIVGIFPEGTRRGRGNLPPDLHGGAALIARMGKAPLVPMGIRGTNDVMPLDGGFHFAKVSCVFGEPIAVSSFDFLPKDERLDACTWYAMRQAFALTRDCAPEEVDMAELFPHSKDYTEVFAQHTIDPVDVAALPAYEPEVSYSTAKDQ